MAPAIPSRNTSTPLPADLRMPHVFVVPPEEEQQDNPPWCCFDADEEPENNGGPPSVLDFHLLDIPYLSQQPERDLPAPIARRTSVHQSRSRASVSRKLEKKQRPEAIKIIESGPSHARHRDAREDSDVVEVVKVKRGREALSDLEENTKVKRSKTLRARATKALQSIKNVGKASHRAHVKQLWTSSESSPGIFKGMQEQIRSQQNQTEHTTSAKKGSLSRAASRSLSQIFHPVKQSRPESLFTLRVPSPAVPAEVHYIPPATNTSSLLDLRYNTTNTSLCDVSSTLTTGEVSNTPIFQIPSVKKKNSFSVRELHRLFSFSSSSLDDPLAAPAVATVPLSSTVSSSSIPSASASTLSLGYPDAPMKEDVSANARANRKLTSRYHSVSRSYRDDHLPAPRRPGDLSFEMRLNSLHFDSLSFDPEEFDVSMERNDMR